jgi:HD-like signal output (HDOD) protein
MMNGETEKLFNVEAADAPRLESSAESTIQKIIGGLPALPSAMEKIMANVNRPDISAGEVAKLAAYSPNLAVSLLRLVNSAHFGLKQRVTSIHHAAVFLGVNTVQSLLLGLASQTLFNSKGNFIDLRRLWRHSLGVALVSRELASRIQCSLSPGEAFTAGLLHDFGKIIWDQYLPEQIQMVKELMKTEEIDGHVAEKRVLGVDHGWVGGRVGDVWNFPSQLCEPIRHHHEPNLASSHWEAICIVRAADVICVNAGLCYWTEFFPQDVDPYTQQMLGITSVMASSLSENLPQKVRDLDSQFKSG